MVNREMGVWLQEPWGEVGTPWEAAGLVTLWDCPSTGIICVLQKSSGLLTLFTV